jgi:hypothetical protein
MTQALSEQALTKLKRHLGEYQPQLEKAIQAIQVLERPILNPKNLLRLSPIYMCVQQSLNPIQREWWKRSMILWKSKHLDPK